MFDCSRAGADCNPGETCVVDRCAEPSDACDSGLVYTDSAGELEGTCAAGDDHVDGGLDVDGGDDIVAPADFALGFGGPEDEEAVAVAQGPSGALVVAGTFKGQVDFGGGKVESAGDGADVFVAKYRADGVFEWVRTFSGGARSIRVSGAQVDSAGSVFVVGMFQDAVNFGGELLRNVDSSGESEDLYAFKLDRDGQHVWSKRYGGLKSERVLASTLAPDGDLYVAGSIDGVVDLGAGPIGAGSNDGFVMRLIGNSGGVTWARALGGAGYETALALAVSETSVVVGGQSFDATKIGSISLPKGGTAMGFVAGLDSLKGGVLWAKRIAGVAGGDSVADVTAIAEDGAGGVFVCGGYSGLVNADAFTLNSASTMAYVSRHSASGAVAWFKNLGASSPCAAIRRVPGRSAALAASEGSLFEVRGDGGSTMSLGAPGPMRDFRVTEQTRLLAAGTFTGVVENQEPKVTLKSNGKRDFFILSRVVPGL